MVLRKVGETLTEIVVNGVTHYAPSAQSEDSSYAIDVDASASASANTASVDIDMNNTHWHDGRTYDLITGYGNGSLISMSTSSSGNWSYELKATNRVEDGTIYEDNLTVEITDDHGTNESLYFANHTSKRTRYTGRQYHFPDGLELYVNTSGSDANRFKGDITIYLYAENGASVNSTSVNVNSVSKSNL